MAKKIGGGQAVVPGQKFLASMHNYASNGGKIKTGSKEYKARLNFAAEGIKAAVKETKAARSEMSSGGPRGLKPAAPKPSSMSPGAGTPKVKKMDEQARRRAAAQAAYKRGFSK